MKNPDKIKATILVIDDDIEIGSAIKEFLEQTEDCYVVHSPDGISGVRTLESLMDGHRPDLVMLDLHMPGMDGVETYEALQNRMMFIDVPVVFITGAEDPVLPPGATVLKKPFQVNTLLSSVRSAIR
jgi:DNA-binding response OmpR family regulator